MINITAHERTEAENIVTEILTAVGHKWQKLTPEKSDTVKANIAKIYAYDNHQLNKVQELYKAMDESKSN